jgi:hypothetical protein
MKINILKVGESEFDKLNVPMLFNDINTRRCFGVIKNNISSYKYSWQSDMIEPLLTEITKDIYAIGIDQNFAVINFKLNSIVFKLELNYTFYDTKIFNEFIYVITELEIVKINSLTFKVMKEYQLPDIFEEILLTDKKITVRCLDQSIIDI